MKVSHSKVHEYLGMMLDYSMPGEVKISMIDYVKRMVEEFPEDITRTATTPAAEYLFKVNDKEKELMEKLSEEFPTSVAKGLFFARQQDPIYKQQ